MSGAAKFKWTTKQAEKAKRIFVQLSNENKRTAKRIAAANGCQPWEMVADSLGGANHLPRLDYSHKVEKSGVWHNTRRKGLPVIISPTGAAYYGTAREVRDNALYPFRRESLATTISLFHTMFLQGTIGREKLREIIADRRRQAIMNSIIDRKETYGDIHENTRVKISAAARVLGITPDEFIKRAIEEAIAFAKHDNRGTLPYTRYELAALKAAGVQFDEAGKGI